MKKSAQTAGTNLPGAVWEHGLIPLTALALYFFSFSVLLSRLLPEYERTVTAVFVSRAGKISLFVTGAVLLIFLACLKFSRPFKFTAFGRRDKLAGGDFLLLLLPLTPVIQYIINNRDILSLAGSLYILTWCLLFSLSLIIVIPVLLGGIGSTRTLAILGMAFAFTIVNMPVLSARYRWFQIGNLKIQLLVFGSIFIAVRTISFFPLGRKIVNCFIAVFFLSNTAIHLATSDWTKIAPGSISRENKLA